MGLIATALSQLLGFGLEQADDFIGRKIESGQLEEAAEATIQFIEAADQSVVEKMGNKGYQIETARTAAELDAARKVLANTRNQTERTQIFNSLISGGPFAEQERFFETQGKAEDTALDLHKTGISTPEGERIGGAFGLGPAESIRQQDLKTFGDKESLKVDERVRAAEEILPIRQALKRTPSGGSLGGGGKAKSEFKPLNSTAIDVAMEASGNPAYIDVNATKLSMLQGRGVVYTKEGMKIKSQGLRFKNPESQKIFLEKKLDIDLDITEVGDDTLREEVDGIREETREKGTAVLSEAETQEEFTALSGAFSSVVSSGGGSEAELEALAKEGETFLRESAKLSKAQRDKMKALIKQLRSRSKR